MNITGTGLAGLSLFLSVAGLGAQPPDTRLQIEVHIYNYSKVSHEMLVRAEQESARIFERIGIATIWLDCPLTSQEAVRNRACALPDAPTRLALRLLSNSMADSLGVGGDIFGSALLPAKKGFGVVANIYADRTRELADRREFEMILGHVVAHELGHLLLGKNAHSPAGIMQARWRYQELRFSRQAAMLFLPREAKRIRANVRARAGNKPASEPSAAITIRVYRLAKVPASTLARAEAEAGKMFEQAGIEVSWFDCGRTDKSIKDQAICSEPADPTKPVLRILSRFRPEPGVIGETIGFANISASIANISLDRASELMPYIAGPRSTVLGLVVAHEIGHLLLQMRGHSPVGIMHFPWSPKELGLANHNFLVFTAKEARAMRERMRSSILDQPLSTP